MTLTNKLHDLKTHLLWIGRTYKYTVICLKYTSEATVRIRPKAIIILLHQRYY
jgi:hypothetical protein